MDKPPIIAVVDLKLNCRCRLATQAEKLMEAGYVSANHKQSPRITAAAINMRLGHRTIDIITDIIRKRHKGNFLREAKKAEGITECHLFSPSERPAEIEAINISKPVRSGGPMRDSYQRTAEELRQAYRKEPEVSCFQHWSIWDGIFHNDSGRLLGYIQLKRYGDLCLYSTILGHGSMLKYGIMPQLHLEMLKWIFRTDNIEFCRGLKWLMYGAWDSGGKGLQLWKKKAGFDPVMFVHKET